MGGSPTAESSGAATCDHLTLVSMQLYGCHMTGIHRMTGTRRRTLKRCFEKGLRFVFHTKLAPPDFPMSSMMVHLKVYFLYTSSVPEYQ